MPYRGAYLPKLYLLTPNGDRLHVWSVSVEAKRSQDKPHILVEAHYESVATREVLGVPIRTVLTIEPRDGVDAFWRSREQAQAMWDYKMAHGYSRFWEYPGRGAIRQIPASSQPRVPPKLAIGFRKEGTLADLLNKR